MSKSELNYLTTCSLSYLHTYLLTHLITYLVTYFFIYSKISHQSKGLSATFSPSSSAAHLVCSSCAKKVPSKHVLCHACQKVIVAVWFMLV